MKKVTAVLSVKFNSSYSQEKLMQVCNEDLDIFRSVPGLIEKYYLAEETTGAISGIYLFETNQDETIIAHLIITKNCSETHLQLAHIQLLQPFSHSPFAWSF